MMKIGIDNFLFSTENFLIGDVNLYPNGKRYVRLFVYETEYNLFISKLKDGVVNLW